MARARRRARSELSMSSGMTNTLSHRRAGGIIRVGRRALPGWWGPATITHMPQIVAFALLVAVLCAPGRGQAQEATYEVKKDAARGTVGVKGKTGITIAAKPGWHV